MAGVDKAWLAVAGARNGESVSPKLRLLLQSVYHQSLAEPLDSMGLKKSLEDLLVFLSGEGRSNANCWAADLFFARVRNGKETGQTRICQRASMMCWHDGRSIT